MLLPFFSFSRLAVFFIFSQTSETSSLRRQTHLIICNAERNDSLQQMSRGVTQPLASIAEVRRFTRSSRVPSCTSNAAATSSSSSSSSQKSSYESSHWNERYEKESHEWMWTFTDEENDEIELALRHFRATNLDVMDVTAETFPLSSSFQNKLLAMRDEILQGRGFAVQRGLTVARYSNKDICTIFCAIGKIMGIPVSQNKFGHVLGHVFDLGNDPLSPSTRLYTTSAAQPFHTDSADIVGLLCIRNASAGGDSQWVSSVRCYEEIKRERADLAEVLLQPFFVSRKGEIPPGCGPTYEMAVFHEVEDDRTGEKNIIGIYDRSFIDAAQTIEGTPKLTSLQIEALNYLDALCVKRQIEMRLQSGDIQWLHNHTTFHARSAFKNESEFPRHLLRLWLSPENGIKLPDAFKTRFNSTERGSPNRGGIKIKDDVKLVCPLEP